MKVQTPFLNYTCFIHFQGVFGKVVETKFGKVDSSAEFSSKIRLYPANLTLLVEGKTKAYSIEDGN